MRARDREARTKGDFFVSSQLNKKNPQMSAKKKIIFKLDDRLIHVQLLAVFVDFSRHRQILLHTGILGMVPSFKILLGNS